MASEDIDVAAEGSAAEAWRRGLASVGALIAALLLIALVVLVANSNRDRDTAARRERQSFEIMVVSRGVDASMARAEAALGRFVISGDPNTGTIYYDEWRRAGRLLARLTKITAADPLQAQFVAELRLLYDARGAELAEPAIRAAYRQGMLGVSMFYQAGKSSNIPAINRVLAQIADHERVVLGRRAVAADRSAARANHLAALLSVIGIVLVIGAAALGWATIKAMTRGRRAEEDAAIEAERAGSLEHAVAARTRELRDAYDRLREESAERAAAEAQLRQVQKMEAVGQLTGGIAHDFNNMLAVVVGGLDLARRRLAQEADEVGRHIDSAMDGAMRAAQLTRRLLAFARAEPLLPEGVDPARLITGMSDLIDRTLGERVVVTTQAENAGWSVWCDPNQLENAILNLAVNARDAMDGEGRLLLATQNVVLRAGEVGAADAGEYVRISVTDDGAGMTPDVIERAFEPFFTTKPVGKGTGLGLSQIFGFARQSEGEVHIASRIGQGTTVALYLPRHVAKAVPEAAKAIAPSGDPAPANDVEAGVAILVVEDDPRVRAATIAGLEELGHRAIACTGGEEALALLPLHSEIRLLLTDVVMPGMTGPQLVARVLPDYPELGVLFVTGYVGDAGDAAQFSGHEVLRKPFTVTALERALAAALARPVGVPDSAVRSMA